MSETLQGITQQEVLEHPQLIEEFRKEINLYEINLSTIDIPKGARLKRNPVDGLKDKGLFNPQSLKQEMINLVNRTSSLSSAQRAAVRYFGERAILNTIQFIVNEKKHHEQPTRADKPSD